MFSIFSCGVVAFLSTFQPRKSYPARTIGPAWFPVLLGSPGLPGRTTVVCVSGLSAGGTEPLSNDSPVGRFALNITSTYSGIVENRA